MAQPKLPNLSDNEQALLYQKLNLYNRGRASYKEAGAYLVVLPREGMGLLSPAQPPVHLLPLRPLDRCSRSSTHSQHPLLLLHPQPVSNGIQRQAYAEQR